MKPFNKTSDTVHSVTSMYSWLATLIIILKNLSTYTEYISYIYCSVAIEWPEEMLGTIRLQSTSKQKKRHKNDQK